MQNTTLNRDQSNVLLNVSCLLAPVAFTFLLPTIVVFLLWPFLEPEKTMLVVPFLLVGALVGGAIKGSKVLKLASSQKVKSVAAHFLIGVGLSLAYVIWIVGAMLWPHLT